MHYIIFDLEATCWDGNPVGRTQEIIEIGALMLDDFGQHIGKFHAFVKPVDHPTLSVFCKTLTGIRQEEIDEASPFKNRGQAFISWIQAHDDDIRLCSWGAKDRELLLQDCTRNGLDTSWLDDYTDLKAEYHQMHRIPKKIGMKKALLREGIPFEGSHHRALDDAQNLTVLFLKYFDMWGW